MSEPEVAGLLLVLLLLGSFAWTGHLILEQELKPKVRTVLWDAISVAYGSILLGASAMAFGYYAAEYHEWHDLSCLAYGIGIYVILCASVTVPCHIWRNRIRH